jgi:hypothetical protein
MRLFADLGDVTTIAGAPKKALFSQSRRAASLAFVTRERACSVLEHSNPRNGQRNQQSEQSPVSNPRLLNTTPVFSVGMLFAFFVLSTEMSAAHATQSTN